MISVLGSQPVFGWLRAMFPALDSASGVKVDLLYASKQAPGAVNYVQHITCPILKIFG